MLRFVSNRDKQPYNKSDPVSAFLRCRTLKTFNTYKQVGTFVYAIEIVFLYSAFGIRDVCEGQQEQ